MKSLSLALIIVSASLTLHASPDKSARFQFTFHPPKAKSFTLDTVAPSKDAAFKIAAKDCFQKLTGGKYPGEERGLDIIDICANPKM